MTKFNVSGVILINILLISISVEAIHLRMVFTKVDCQNFANDLITNFTCELQSQKDGYSPTFNSQLILTEDLSNITFVIKLKFLRENSLTNYLTETLDGCEALTDLKGNKLLEKIRNEIRRVSNLPYKCPLKKKILYYMKEFTGDNLGLPSYLPQWSFILDSFTYSKGRALFTISVFGRIERFERQHKKNQFN